MYLQYW